MLSKHLYGSSQGLKPKVCRNSLPTRPLSMSAAAMYCPVCGAKKAKCECVKPHGTVRTFGRSEGAKRAKKADDGRATPQDGTECPIPME